MSLGEVWVASEWTKLIYLRPNRASSSFCSIKIVAFWLERK